MTGTTFVGFKTSILATCAMSALVFAASAQAQVASDGATAQQEPAEAQTVDTVQEPPQGPDQSQGRVVITGSRIEREGFTAPTPLAVMDEEILESRPTANVADLVNTMPVFSGSTTPNQNGGVVSAGTSGVNGLNLRGLGTGRTLVLVDGQRSVGSYLTGVVDVNTIPQQLIERVEVVTGGASAVYGSDAVGGVANFILNKTFTGFKGELSGGVTDYGDNSNYQLQLTAGTPFADGRGHIILSGEFVNKEGILLGSGGIGKRPWNSTGYTIIRNPNYTPTNGQPELLFREQVALAIATRGGIINNTALRGWAFGEGGTPFRFDYGTLFDGRNIVGGDWATANVREDRGNSLSPSEMRQNYYLRANYNLTDNLNVFASASWAQSETWGKNSSLFSLGDITNVSIDNAFLPAVVRAEGLAAGVTSFTMGSYNWDLPDVQANNIRTITRYVIGAEGDFDLFDSNWNWDAYYQYGESDNFLSAPGSSRIDRYALARDAVFHPTTGEIVCRSTITDPTNGCVPYNLFGIGVNGPEVAEYISGDISQMTQILEQDVWGASIAGDLFSLWAGPVSIALNAEHRTESVDGYNDDLSDQRLYYTGNYQVTVGETSVSEVGGELVVPLANGVPFADAWDLQLAGRMTDYSTSGKVETWKIGTTYSPIPDLTFRMAQSRDIRAPNLSELYVAQTQSARSSAFDPFTNSSVAFFTLTGGNLALTPEIADTFGIGVVTQPSFLPGFGASVDYWDIEIADAIGNIGAQATLDFCFEGDQRFCQNITRDSSGVVTSILQTSYNLAVNQTRGIDFEASYRFALEDFIPDWTGDISLRAVATNYLESYTDNGIGTKTDTVGQNTGGGPPDWRYNFSVTYDAHPVRLSMTGRGLSDGVYNNNYILCTSGCPTSTVQNRTVDFNSIDGALYFDMSGSYTIETETMGEFEIFGSIRNLFNEDPAPVAGLGSGNAWWGPIANATLYDTEGRTYRLGFRVTM